MLALVAVAVALCPGEQEGWLVEAEPGFVTAQPEGLQLAILGHVFDVSLGEEFYGPGMAYEKLLGADVTRAFAVHSTKKKARRAPVLDLDDVQLAAAVERLRLFVEKYPCLGVVEGLYYDAEGAPTAALAEVKQRALAAPAAESPSEADPNFASKCPLIVAAKFVRQRAGAALAAVGQFLQRRLLA